MSWHEQLVRFAAVGGAATALHYIVLFLLVQHSFAEPVVASSAGFVLSASFNYALNRQWTFSSTRSHAQAAPRFLVVALCGLCINGAVLWLLLLPEVMHYLAAQILATAGTLAWNFALNRFWTFRQSRGLTL